MSLNVEAILQEPTIRRRREKLRVVANGLSLEDMYGATLGRIQAQGGERSRFGMMALMWICHSERPLKADELCHALGVEIGSTYFDPDNVPSIGTLLSCCQGLFTVDKEGSTARLVHFTLREYLSGRPDIFQKPHSVIAETCLTYLNSQLVISLPATLPPGTQAIPFLRYSASYWGTHGKKELSDDVKSLALKLLEKYDDHISIGLLLGSRYERFYLASKVSRFTGLHCASFFGLVEVVKSLIEIGSFDINQRDPMGITPLGWAARGGHEEVVQLLLGRGDISPDEPDYDDRTPLLFAAENGQEGVAQLLLGRRDVNPDGSLWGGAPLTRAAMNGHEGIVRQLLAQGNVNPNKIDYGLRTALSHAAGNGHEGVVQLLLERRDVNPEGLNRRGRTALSYAAESGHEGVVQLLLGRGDVNPDRPDNFNRTPLSYAARNGHERVVQLLLGRRDVYPEGLNRRGRTALSYATENGHEGVVQLLLGQGDVNPKRADYFGRTPLWYAEINEHKGVVKLILDWKSSHLLLPQSSEA